MMKPLNIILILTLAVCGHAEELVPGNSVFGQRNFIEYTPGELPLIITAPHGGRLTPEEIQNRTNGVTDIDANTQELSRTIAAVIHAETGRHIHLVVCRLHRSKLDANRDLAEAAQGNESAEQAWQEYHAFIETACDAAVRQFGVAFLIDLHGHGHADPRVELGYLHNALDLADCDEALNESSYVNASSLRWIVERSDLSHVDLLRGPLSLGALLEARGFPATPSPRMRVPTEPFFRGGYTIARHCKAEKNITGLQIEANRPRLRDTAENRLRFANALVSALREYFPAHLGISLSGEPGSKERLRADASLAPAQ
jgi:N-formylglutamate amidohydrolase